MTLIRQGSFKRAKHTNVKLEERGGKIRAYCPVYFNPVNSRLYCRSLCRYFKYPYYSYRRNKQRCYCCSSTSAATKPPNTPQTPAPPPASSCKCGVPQSSRNRIVGGQPAKKNEYPWQVALVSIRSLSPFCGGTLISSRTVLMAPHCRTSVSLFLVHVGEHDVTIADGEQKIRPSSFISHPQYNSGTYDNDFAIITLSREVTFSRTIMPVCLPTPGSNYDSQEATVTGWGTFASGSNEVPKTLNEVDVDTISNTACTTNTLYRPGTITNNMLCARRSGKDSCQGSQIYSKFL